MVIVVYMVNLIQTNPQNALHIRDCAHNIWPY